MESLRRAAGQRVHRARAKSPINGEKYVVKKFLVRMYDKIVGSNAVVWHFYTMYKMRHTKLHRYCRPLSWAYLCGLLLKYAVFGVEAKLKYPESSVQVYPDREKLIGSLAGAEVLSFDVFGTLLLCRFEHPEDLYDIVGYELGLSDYREMRIGAERAARRRKGERADLREICALLEERHAVDADRAYALETDAVRKFYCANPYFTALLRDERLEGKKTIAVCDACFSADFLKSLLGEKGFSIEEIFVSNEYGRSKTEGGLWDAVREKYGRGLFHMGSIYAADVKNCCRHGLRACGIPDLNLACSLYREHGVHSLAQSLYSALVNGRLHAEGGLRDPYYEHGYVYGGIMVFGFCTWLERLARHEKYDCFLFLARDMEPVYNAYSKYFGKVPSVYLKISRFAAMKLALPEYFEIFFNTMFAEKARKRHKISAGKALEQAELSFLAAKLPQGGAEELNESLLPSLRRFLFAHMKEITQRYAADAEAFERYISPLTEGKKRICVVDLGWRGTIFSMLEAWFRERRPEVTLRSAMLGVRDHFMANHLTDCGKMDSYLFSHTKNTNYMIDETQIMLFETMFSSEAPTTVGYAVAEDGSGQPVAGQTEERRGVIFRQIRRGMADFCGEFKQAADLLPFRLRISGTEAYAPFADALADVRYNLSLFGKLKTSADPNSVPVSMRDLLEEIGYTSDKKFY